jgi:hypothetical protein
MKQLLITLLLIIMSTPTFASDLKSDEMCQQYVTGLFTDITQAEQIGMQALRVSLNRIGDTHPEYLEMATQIAFGTALDDAGHRRVGQYINAMCTQDGTVLNDIVYEVLLKESISLSKGKNSDKANIK